jgi:hypothetical protein
MIVMIMMMSSFGNAWRSGVGLVLPERSCCSVFCVLCSGAGLASVQHAFGFVSVEFGELIWLASRLLEHAPIRMSTDGFLPLLSGSIGIFRTSIVQAPNA